MVRFEASTSRSRQRGWAGLIVLLVALVIVGMLLKTVLQEYGLTGTAGPASKATPVDPVSHDVTTTDVTPRNAIERARGLESAVQQQAVEKAQRIDDALKQ
ncbi:MAG TPA: hypothetical protein VGL25_11120 [Casimicrobiaceae bacterium]|jgi:hypothetical protein